MVVKSKYDQDDDKLLHINFKKFLSYQFMKFTNKDKNAVLENRFRNSNPARAYKMLAQASRIFNFGKAEHRRNKIGYARLNKYVEI